MQPFLKLAKVWPWLPHFRVVAEVESLSRAARRFGMTSAALSKAIRTLEKLLGVQLFDRTGGKLHLNEQGRALLAAVRASMRDLDDAITGLHTRSDALRIAIDPALAMLVLPASSSNLELLDVPVEIAPSLLRGDVDAVVHVGAITHAELDSMQIATLERGVYVAPGTKAAPRDPLTIEGAFPILSLEEPRQAVTASTLAHALAWVTSGSGAAVLPSAIANRLGLRAVPVKADLAAAFAWRETAKTRCAAI